MMSRDEFLAFVGRIVAEVAPSETTAFAVAGPQVADALYSGQGVGVTMDERRSSEFQFLDAATQVLQFVGLMIGTFEAIRKLIKTMRTPQDVTSKQKLVSEWTNELQKSGLPDATATEIATRFGEEFASTIKQT